jgi:hypothetical protein
MSLELTITDGIIMVGLDDRILSCQCYSTVVVNMVSELVSHHIALPLYIGQLAMYIKYFLCLYIIFRLTT